MKTEAGNNIKEVLFKGNLPVAGWLPTDPPGHSRYNLISLLASKNINLLNLTKIHLLKHPSPVSLSHLEPCFSSSPSCWSRVCHQRRGGSGWLSTGWQEKKLFWSIIQFFKKIINVRLFGSAKPTVILHSLITVRGASGLLPGEKKPHKTYRPVRETS